MVCLNCFTFATIHPMRDAYKSGEIHVEWESFYPEGIHHTEKPPFGVYASLVTVFGWRFCWDD